MSGKQRGQISHFVNKWIRDIIPERWLTRFLCASQTHRTTKTSSNLIKLLKSTHSNEPVGKEDVVFDGVAGQNNRAVDWLTLQRNDHRVQQEAGRGQVEHLQTQETSAGSTSHKTLQKIAT